MKKILSILTMFVVLGSTAPAFAGGFNNADMHRDNGMPMQERMHQPKHEPNFHENKKPQHHNNNDVSRIIKGAAVGAIIASLLN